MPDKGKLKEKVEISEILGTEEARARIIIELSSPDFEKIKMFSDLYIEEIPVASALTTVSEKLKLDSLKSFLDNFLKFRISKDRLGRFEMLNIAIGIMEQQKKGGKGLLDYLSALR